MARARSSRKARTAPAAPATPRTGRARPPRRRRCARARRCRSRCARHRRRGRVRRRDRRRGQRARAQRAGQQDDQHRARGRRDQRRARSRDRARERCVGGQLDRALQKLQPLSAATPTDGFLSLYLGWALALKGDQKAALAAFDQAMAANAGLKLTVLYWRGRAKLVLADLAGARADFAAVLAVAKDHIGAQVGLAAATPPSQAAQQESDLLAILARKDIDAADPRVRVQAWTLAGDDARRGGRARRRARALPQGARAVGQRRARDHRPRRDRAQGRQARSRERADHEGRDRGAERRARSARRTARSRSVRASSTTPTRASRRSPPRIRRRRRSSSRGSGS